MDTACTSQNETSRRISRLGDELAHAWSETDPQDVKQWLRGSARIFPQVLGRRVKGVVKLTVSVTRGVYEESRDVIAAAVRKELSEHLQTRVTAASDGARELASNTWAFSRALTEAFKQDPGRAVPQFATLVLTSLLVSGGVDGNGGAPDADIVLLGIGAHRSPLTHSILMGAALETGLLSFLALVNVIHDKLPTSHDPFWDALRARSDDIVNAAATGVSVGMAYHLFVDGVAQPAPYQDLPISMPMEAHQTVFVVNAAAEAIHAGTRTPSAQTEPPPMKPAVVATAGAPTPPQSSPTASQDRHDEARPLSPNERNQLEAQHRACIAHGYRVNKQVIRALQLSSEQVARVEKYGSWFEALETGRLQPLTEHQRHFVDAMRGTCAPRTPDEILWIQYRLEREFLVDRISTLPHSHQAGPYEPFHRTGHPGAVGPLRRY